jgi:hypothetical protein
MNTKVLLTQRVNYIIKLNPYFTFVEIEASIITISIKSNTLFSLVTFLVFIITFDITDSVDE